MSCGCGYDAWFTRHVNNECAFHRKSSLYLPLGSVNLVLKVMGTPDEISSPPGWNRVSPGCPRNFNAELTEPTRQIKTTFPMNVHYSHDMGITCGSTCVTWLIHMCNMTHLCVRYVSLTWILPWDSLKEWHLLVWNDSSHVDDMWITCGSTCVTTHS